MNAADVIAALDLPAAARVDQRVPKKLLIENGASTAADKRRINDGLEEVHWIAALKPGTVGVPEFRDATREYLEIAVLSAALRTDAEADRLATLIHRAVPYPIFLMTSQGDALSLSLAHKRWSQVETDTTVLDGAPVLVNLQSGRAEGIVVSVLRALPVGCQPRTNLYALYQGWIDTLAALLAAAITGRFTVSQSPEQAAARRSALAECARIEALMVRLRAAASKERQVARQVELNLELRRAQTEHAAARAKL